MKTEVDVCGNAVMTEFILQQQGYFGYWILMSEVRNSMMLLGYENQCSRPTPYLNLVHPGTVVPVRPESI